MVTRFKCFKELNNPATMLRLSFGIQESKTGTLSMLSECVCTEAVHIPAAEGRLAEAAGEEKSAKSAIRSELPPKEN